MLPDKVAGVNGLTTRMYYQGACVLSSQVIKGFTPEENGKRNLPLQGSKSGQVSCPDALMKTDFHCSAHDKSEQLSVVSTR